MKSIISHEDLEDVSERLRQWGVRLPLRANWAFRSVVARRRNVVVLRLLLRRLRGARICLRSESLRNRRLARKLWRLGRALGTLSRARIGAHRCHLLIRGGALSGGDWLFLFGPRKVELEQGVSELDSNGLTPGV